MKLGHNDEQKLLAKDGLPAAGWINNVYIQGKKLIADFVDIPKVIADLIKKKAYRKVSVEIFSGVTLKGEKYPNLLGACALLGADTPAVLSLADIPTDFSKDLKNSTDFTWDKNELNMFMKTFEISLNEMKGEINMPDKEKEAVQTGGDSEKLSSLVEEQKKQIEELSSKIAEFSKKNDEIDSYKAKILELEKSKDQAEIEKFTLSLEAKGLLSPSMKPFASALCNDNSKKEFSVDDKKLSQKEVLENLLVLAKEVFAISTEEKTKDVKPEEKNLEKDITEFMNTNKVGYREAYTSIMKKQA